MSHWWAPRSRLCGWPVSGCALRKTLCSCVSKASPWNVPRVHSSNGPSIYTVSFCCHACQCHHQFWLTQGPCANHWHQYSEAAAKQTLGSSSGKSRISDCSCPFIKRLELALILSVGPGYAISLLWLSFPIPHLIASSSTFLGPIFISGDIIVLQSHIITIPVWLNHIQRSTEKYSLKQ